jgi:hypothetical protein
MQRIIKNSIVLISGSIALLPVLLSVVFLVGQLQTKERMEKALESEYLQTITLPLDELLWIKKNKELKIGDELFDVKTWFVQNNTAVVTGLYDKDEKNLHLQLETLINKRQTQNKETNSVNTAFLFTFNSCENGFLTNLPVPFLRQAVFGLSPTPHLSTVFIDCAQLPPNVL